jgi:hypothetical protein
MEYLKSFEELSPETYKSASDKLMDRGETIWIKIMITILFGTIIYLKTKNLG